MLKSVSFNKFAGVRNDVSLDRFDPPDLSMAVNVDLDETGRISRRAGSQQVNPGAYHSLWSNTVKSYAVRDGVLNYIDPDLVHYPIKPIAGSRVRYAEVNNTVYWTDGVESGQLRTQAESMTLGIVPPTQLSATPINGSMRAGRYLLTMTYMRADGEESGAPLSTEITLSANQGVRLFNIPVSSDPTVVAKNIYMSAWNGELPHRVATLTNSETVSDITDESNLGMPVRTLHMRNMPAGEIIEYFAGRLYVASGRYLWYSQAYEYGLVDARSGFVGFDADIRTFAPVSDGVFVGTDEETYWLAGTDPTAFVLQRVATYGTVRGTEHQVPGLLVTQEGLPGQVACWFSKKGMCIGLAGGTMRNTTGGRYIPPVAREGSSLLKIRSGTPQLVFSLEA